MPAERQLRCNRKSSTAVQSQKGSAPAARSGGQHPQGVCRIRSAPAPLTAAQSRPPLQVCANRQKGSAPAARLAPCRAQRGVPFRATRHYALRASRPSGASEPLASSGCGPSAPAARLAPCRAQKGRHPSGVTKSAALSGGAVFYSSQLLTVLGKGSTSRMFEMPVRYMTQRSKPRPKPAWRAVPYFLRSR